MAESTLPEASSEIASDKVTEETVTKPDVDKLKEKLRKLKLVETYKKKWPFPDLVQRVKDWNEVAKTSFADLFINLVKAFPDATMYHLVQNITTDPELAHIERLADMLQEIFFDDTEED